MTDNKIEILFFYHDSIFHCYHQQGKQTACTGGEAQSTEIQISVTENSRMNASYCKVQCIQYPIMLSSVINHKKIKTAL